MAVSGSLREVPGAGTGTGTATAAVQTGRAPDPQHSPSVEARSFQWGETLRDCPKAVGAACRLLLAFACLC